MAENLNLKLRIRPGEAKRGCTKTLTTGGMRLTVRVPAGTTSGRVLILRAVPFPIGARDVAVKIEVKRKTGWLWACLAAGAAAVILHLSGFRTPGGHAENDGGTRRTDRKPGVGRRDGTLIPDTARRRYRVCAGGTGNSAAGQLAGGRWKRTAGISGKYYCARYGRADGVDFRIPGGW